MATSQTQPTARIEVATSKTRAITDHARAVLGAALEPEERDDRFDNWPSEASEQAPSADDFLAALAFADGVPVGFVGGDIGGDRGHGERPQLDTIVAAPAGTDDGWAAALLTSMLDELVPYLDVDEFGDVEVWAKPARRFHQEVASTLSMRELRALHQMRCTLPVAAEALPTRAYTDDDFDELLSVNNRAFAGHPDQGAQTAMSLAGSMSEPWFQAAGVRLFERDGRLAGFCWTKIHPSPPSITELGEIYVIGVDPDFHGQGLGVPMTAAGLAWLTDQGIDVGMLYVEADNVPAIKTYERLGFSVLRTDRAWLWSPKTAQTAATSS
ncbi:MAG: mycothiol synthase [Acidimicrobiales bacterium]